jgi:DNA-binding transcriptional LysR family regulator
MKIPWDDFRLIKAIADHRSLNGAAEALGLNHSTVFRRLGDLEKRLGAVLFERHRSGYSTTQAGEEMVLMAARMDEDVTTFLRKMAGQSPSPTGDLRITTNDTLLLYLMPVFAAFRRAFPAIRADIVLSNQALNLSKRDADIAIRATDTPPDTLVGRRVAAIAWAVYGCARDFDLALASPAFDPLTLFDASWVSLGEQFSHVKAARYVLDHVSPERVAMTINTVLGLAEAVEQGIGIGPLPCFIADQKPGLRRLTPLNPDFSTGLWLLTHPDLRASPRVRAFLDLAATEIAALRPLFEGQAAATAVPGLQQANSSHC